MPPRGIGQSGDTSGARTNPIVLDSSDDDDYTPPVLPRASAPSSSLHGVTAPVRRRSANRPNDTPSSSRVNGITQATQTEGANVASSSFRPNGTSNAAPGRPGLTDLTVDSDSAPEGSSHALPRKKKDKGKGVDRRPPSTPQHEPGTWENPEPLVIHPRRPPPRPPRREPSPPRHAPGTWENPEPLIPPPVSHKRAASAEASSSKPSKRRTVARKTVGGGKPGAHIHYRHHDEATSSTKAPAPVPNSSGARTPTRLVSPTKDTPTRPTWTVRSPSPGPRSRQTSASAVPPTGSAEIARPEPVTEASPEEEVEEVEQPVEDDIRMDDGNVADLDLHSEARRDPGAGGDGYQEFGGVATSTEQLHRKVQVVHAANSSVVGVSEVEEAVVSVRTSAAEQAGTGSVQVLQSSTTVQVVEHVVTKPTAPATPSAPEVEILVPDVVLEPDAEVGSTVPQLSALAAGLTLDLPPVLDIQISPEECQSVIDMVSVSPEPDIFAVLKASHQLPRAAPPVKPFGGPSIEIEQPQADRRGVAKRKADRARVEEYNRHLEHASIKPQLRCAIFEAIVDCATSNDEPYAPALRVNPTTDGPPDLEFEYSNVPLYSDDVPDPELGKGCDCEGPCDPNSNTCSCVRRQELYFYSTGHKGFNYNIGSETVKQNDCPIWECGPACGCPPECLNRVVQRGRKTKVELFKTRQKGWGVKAAEWIQAGKFIGVYAGEVITEPESERRGQTYEKIGRTYLFDLDGYHLAHPPEGLEQIDVRGFQLAEIVKDRAEAARLESDNPELYSYSAYSVDAFHYGNYTRYLNHSCDPNLVITPAYVYDAHPERPQLVIIARRDIAPGEELCISYKGVPDAEDLQVAENELLLGQGTSSAVPLTASRGKKSKTTAMAHVAVSPQKRQSTRHDECRCGAYNCNGRMFNGGSDVEDE